jgi:hypothetical protein
MASIDLIADRYVAARAELDRSTLAALEAAEAPGLREQVARAAMQERLDLAVKCYDAGDTTSQLNVIAGSGCCAGSPGMAKAGPSTPNACRSQRATWAGPVRPRGPGPVWLGR